MTVVQAGDKALNTAYHNKFRDHVAAQLETRGVKFILGDSIDGLDDASLEGTVPLESRTITTRGGTVLEADLLVRVDPFLLEMPSEACLQIPTFGPRGVYTDFLKHGSSPTIAASVLENTRLNVRPTLQLKSNPRVFALGDVIEWPEQHMLAKTGAHAGVVTPNVIAVLNSLQRGQDLGAVKKLKNYGGFMEAISITNGQVRTYVASHHFWCLF